MFGAANGMLKEGARHYSGLEEALYRNIDAVQQLSQMTRSALGPHGKFGFILNIMPTKRSGFPRIIISHPF